MRVLVCGGRDYHNKELVFSTLDRIKPTSIIHGAARGADSLAAEWAVLRNVQQLSYPARWREYGKGAGNIRNQQMLNEGKPDLVVAFPGGRGTADMMSRAVKNKIKLERVLE